MIEKRQTKSFAYVAIAVMILGEITMAYGVLFIASIVAALLAAIQVITSRGIHQVVGIFVMLSALAVAAFNHREYVHVGVMQISCSEIHRGDSHEDVVSLLTAVQSEVSTEITDDSIIVRDNYFSMEPVEICRFKFKNGQVSYQTRSYGH